MVTLYFVLAFGGLTNLSIPPSTEVSVFDKARMKSKFFVGGNEFDTFFWHQEYFICIFDKTDMSKEIFTSHINF